LALDEMSIRAGFSVLFCLLVIGCSSSRIGLSKSEDKMRASVLRRVPIGSSLEHATNVMSAAGFTCDVWRFKTNQYAVCARQRTVPLVWERLWVVDFPFDTSEKVTNVTVHVSTSWWVAP
jgi:hypothetical protein